MFFLRGTIIAILEFSSVVDYEILPLSSMILNTTESCTASCISPRHNTTDVAARAEENTTRYSSINDDSTRGSHVYKLAGFSCSCLFWLSFIILFVCLAAVSSSSVQFPLLCSFTTGQWKIDFEYHSFSPPYHGFSTSGSFKIKNDVATRSNCL